MRERFGRYVEAAAKAAGYDTDERGGKAALARAIGMDASNVGRMLEGKSLPHPKFYGSIAKAVKVNPLELLVEAGILPRESLPTQNETGPSQVGSRSITPSEAADQLGIFDPIAREMFLGTVERLKRIQYPTEDIADEHGGSAAQM